MKTFLLTLILLLAVAQAFSQGKVSFKNDVFTRLTTNDLQGSMGFTSGVNAYRIGLYIAPAGTTDPQSFSLIGLATNLSSSLLPQLNGQFNGNGADSFVISNNSGQEIAFQIRAWSLFAGLSYEAALLYTGPETVYAGRSTIGHAIPATGSALEPDLFGTVASAGQVGGFTLTPIISNPPRGR